MFLASAAVELNPGGRPVCQQLAPTLSSVLMRVKPGSFQDEEILNAAFDDSIWLMCVSHTASYMAAQHDEPH